MNRNRVVIAGLGDVGMLTAIRRSRHFDVVGISAKPALVRDQELRSWAGPMTAPRHPRVWERIGRRLGGLGVGLHAGHRAVAHNGFTRTPPGCRRTCSMSTAWFA